MALDPCKYYAVECMPEGLDLADPKKYTSKQSERILCHWYARQHKGLPPFVFSGEDYARGQKKTARTGNYVDPDKDGV